jgi:sulfatase maturation enzyme AslB (radical SAM superfamily)
MSTNYYCSAPFVHLQFYRENISQPCCAWNHEDSNVGTISGSSVDPFNDPLMEDLRQHMINNIPHPGCSTCNSYLEKDISSLRDFFNRNYPKTYDKKLQYLEFNLGNVCNLKCRMCNSRSSSRWRSDEIKLGKHPIKVYKRNLNSINIDLSILNRIRFMGGEPALMQKNIIEIINAIKNSQGNNLSNLSVTITTNGTILLCDSLMKLLEECKSIALDISIDGVEEVNDYVRSGAIWKNIYKNISWYQTNCSNKFTLFLKPAWSIFSINNLEKTINLINSDFNRYKLKSQAVTEPKWQSIRNLPTSAKDKIYNQISKYQSTTDSFIKQTISIIAEELKLESNVPIVVIREKIKKLDIIRNEDFFKIDPEMYQLIFF